MNKYVKQYKWSNVFAMLRNQKKDPEICQEDFKGRLVVITGATSGIGQDAAMMYASHGAEILSINRNEEKSQKLCKKINNRYGTECSYLIADFTSLADVHRVSKYLAELERPIDVLIHNAGVYLTEKTMTDDGLEQVFQCNYLSTFIMNYYLKDKFIKQNYGRILFVSSEAYRFAVWGLNMDDLFWDRHKYSGIKSYGAAKMAQLLSMIKFVECFEGTKVTMNAMHPGNVKTNSGSSNGRLYKFFKKNVIDKGAISIEKSSQAIYYLGASSKVEGLTNLFFHLTTIEALAPPALDKNEADQLWEISLKLGDLMNE